MLKPIRLSIYDVVKSMTNMFYKLKPCDCVHAIQETLQWPGRQTNIYTDTRQIYTDTDKQTTCINKYRWFFIIEIELN